MRRRLRVVQTHRAEKIALDRARSGAPISPQCNRAPKPPNRAHRRRGTLAKSQCKPNFRRLVPTMMASIAGGTRVGRVCSVAFGLIARRVGRVTRIAMVGCASGRTRTIERDTKGAKTRFIATAYGKFESSSLRDCLLEEAQSLVKPIFGYRKISGERAQVEVVGGEIGDRPRGGAPHFGGLQFRFDDTRDA